MTTYNRYQKLQKYINNVPQEEYKQGELIGEVEYETLEECEGQLQYRWVVSDTMCSEYDLYSLEVKQVTTDGGVTWENTDEIRLGPLVESWSNSCGVVTQYRWLATGVYGCDSGLATEQFIYQQSNDFGETWTDVQPLQYKYETTDEFTDACLNELDESLTLECDADEVSLQVDGGLQLGTWRSDLEDSVRTWWVTYDRYFKIDWGDEVTEHRHSGSLTSLIELPHYISKPQSITHTYSASGVKTIKIYGPIKSLTSTQPLKIVSCKQPYRTNEVVKEFSYTPGAYGGSYKELIAPNFINLSIPITNIDSLGEWENLTNFDTFNISGASNFIGTMDAVRANTLNISNCSKLVDASNFTAVNEINTAGCKSMTHYPKVVDVSISVEDAASYFPASLKYLEIGGKIQWRNSDLYNANTVLTHLVNLEKISGTFYGGNVVTFNSTFTGLTALTDVAGLTIKSGNETFKNCINITEMPTVVLEANKSYGMFINTGIIQVDLSKISGSGNFMNAFRNCSKLTSVVGRLRNVSQGSDISGCFAENSFLNTVDIQAPLLTTMETTFLNCINLKNLKLVTPALTSVDVNFLRGVSALNRVEVDLTSYTGDVSYLVRNAPYMLFRNIGLLDSYNLSFSRWEARPSILNTLITYSQNRSANPCTITLSELTKSQISVEEMAQINAKGYTIA